MKTCDEYSFLKGKLTKKTKLIAEQAKNQKPSLLDILKWKKEESIRNKRKKLVKSFKEENRDDIDRYHELIKLKKEERLEQEEKERLAQIERDRLAQVERERAENERLAQIERERTEKEGLEQEENKLENPYPKHKWYSEVRAMLKNTKDKQFLIDNIQVTQDGKINFIKMWRTFSLFSLENIDNDPSKWTVDYSFRDLLDKIWEKGKKYFTITKVFESIEKSGKKILRFQQQFEEILKFLPGEEYEKENKLIYLIKLLGLYLPPKDNYIFGHKSDIYKQAWLSNNDFARETGDAILIWYINNNSSWGIVRWRIEKASNVVLDYYTWVPGVLDDDKKTIYLITQIFWGNYRFFPNFLVYENNPL